LSPDLPGPASFRTVVMPKWGMSMTEGTINSWLVDDHAEVHAGQEIAEIETDKTVSTVEAEVSGVLHQVRRAGTSAGVGVVIALLAESLLGEDVISSWRERTPPPAQAADEPGSMESGLVEAGGRSLGYDRAGSGATTVLLLHGFGGDRSNWLFTMDLAGEDYTVVALDLPGHGASEKTVGDGSAETFAQTVGEAVDALGIQSAHLIGHSLGGAVAQALLQRHRERVLSLTLIDSAGLGPEINGSYLDAFIAARTSRELKGVLQQLVCRRELVTRDMVESVLRYKRLDGVAGALGVVRAAMAEGSRQRYELAGPTSAAGVPVLVLWGAQDTIIPAAHAQSVAAAHVITLEGVGHLPHVESPRAVNRAITEFLARQP
jgi:pyruvate dehydrogenase E2 component (dihydrolipoamide acetyltransferase)